MPSSPRGADCLIRTLVGHGVQRIFTLSGNQIMSVFDAALDEAVELMHVRHEAPAVHMADAWGRLTGQSGVELVTAGPGFANCLSALYVAQMAESPLVLISGAAPQGKAGRGAFQQMAQREMASFVTKASWTVESAANIAADLARAMKIAGSGRPGPVHLSIPADVLEARTEALGVSAEGKLPAADDDPSDRDLQAISRTLSDAARPLVLLGPAMMRTDAAEMIEAATGIPVIGMESPRGANGPSVGALAEILPQADAVLLLGKKLDYTLRLGGELVFGSDCRLLQVDAEMESLDMTRAAVAEPARIVRAICADPFCAARLIASQAGGSAARIRPWFDDVHQAISFRPADWPQLQSQPLHPAEVCLEVNRFLRDADKSVSVCDGGEFGQWAQGCLRATHSLMNGPSGSIGSVLPLGLGARTVFPQARIVAVCGDGTVGFHLSELDTALRHELPIILIVGNDARWNAEHQIQIKKFGDARTTSCDLLPTRYDQVAVALGCHGELVTQIAELRPALTRAEQSGLPACINVMIDGVAAPIIRRH